MMRMPPFRAPTSSPVFTRMPGTCTLEELLGLRSQPPQQVSANVLSKPEVEQRGFLIGSTIL